MSNPSFSNIDRWLFELVEGNLSPEQIAQLEAFLLRHPELDIDKDMWDLAKIEQKQVVYPNQDKFIRRKPVGLYMMAGMTSIALFVSIGLVDLFATDATVSLTANSSDTEIENNTTSLNQQSNSKSTLERGNQIESYQDGLGLNDLHAPISTDLAIGIKNRNNKVSNKMGVDEAEMNLLKNQVSQAIAQIQAIDQFTDLKTEKNQTLLETKPVELFETVSGRTWTTLQRPLTSRLSTSILEDNFSSKMNRAVRALGRMMDYPVALKNLKDPMFNLPGMLPIDVNNGLIGTLPGTRVQTLSRAQWLGQANEQFMNQIAVDGYVYGLRGGVGVQINHAYYGNGQLSNANVALTYSPKISVNRNVLIEPSVRFKMGTKSIDASKIDGSGLVEVDRNTVLPFYSNASQPLGQQLWYRDLGLGMMVNTKWFYAGVQTDNVFRHYDNIYSGNYADNRRAATHFIATIGTDYESKRESIGLSPYLVYHQREALQEVWAGVNTRIEWFTVGASISDKLDATAALGVKLNRLAVTCGADYLTSSMLGSKQLSYQLHVRFINLSGNPRQKLLNL
jgi:type IX secretion system PorP/SprF family membrane protein